MGQRLAIHQPNYIPWMGYFHKASQVESFVFFDNVPAPQGKSWLSRNRINLRGKPAWLTVPIRKAGRSGQLIREVEINYESPWIRKHLGTVQQAYQGTPFYDEVVAVLETTYQQQHRYLADLNIALIEAISRLIGLECSFVRASDRVPAGKRKTEMIVQVCQAFDCSEYLTGVGKSLSFLDTDLFELAGVELRYQSFEAPTYEHPGGTYHEGMSILDALCCLGPVGVREALLRQTGYLESPELAPQDAGEN